jgi:hypothetical protein
VGEGDTLDEELGVSVVVGSPTGLAPLPHPTAKTSTAAPPNSAIAVLAPDFIKRSILMSARFVHSRVHINYWIVAAILSSCWVTIPRSHHCLRAQCASKGCPGILDAVEVDLVVGNAVENRLDHYPRHEPR